MVNDALGPAAPNEADSVNLGFKYDGDPGFKYDGDPGFKYDGNFGPMSATGGTAPPLYDLPGLVAPTHDAGPAAPNEADSVNLGFKYDAIHPDYDPFPSPITKASPYYTGPAPKESDPGEPNDEQP